MENKDKMRLSLFDNQYATREKHPKKTGIGEISKAQVKEMVEAIKEGGLDSLPLSCAAWERTSKGGKEYIFVTVEIKKPDGEVPF